MKNAFLSTMLLSLLVGIPSAWAQERTCSSSDFQSCKNCAQLGSAVDLKHPTAGDYLRGAEWNGLYSAYVLNCPVIGAKLIKAGANPSAAGPAVR